MATTTQISGDELKIAKLQSEVDALQQDIVTQSGIIEKLSGAVELKDLQNRQVAEAKLEAFEKEFAGKRTVLDKLLTDLRFQRERDTQLKRIQDNQELGVRVNADLKLVQNDLVALFNSPRWKGIMDGLSKLDRARRFNNVGTAPIPAEVQEAQRQFREADTTFRTLTTAAQRALLLKQPLL
jgi:hypothetical protein